MVEAEERVTMHMEYEWVLDYFLLRKVMRAGVEAALACSLLLACEKGMGQGR